LSKNQEPINFSEELSQKDRIMETVYLELRADGLILENFALKYSFDILFELRGTLFSLLSAGFISIDEAKIRLTPKGYSICDEICLCIIKDIEKAMHL
jgi:coproporphyrinogen III oxidase-like Fe-S oxidoreductase